MGGTDKPRPLAWAGMRQTFGLRSSDEGLGCSLGGFDHRNLPQCWAYHRVRPEISLTGAVTCFDLSAMKAVILAAGKGTRMRDLTNDVPKPMLKVHGKPILEHIITGVLSAGIQDIFIVTGFRAEAIEQYFGTGAEWGANVNYGRQIIQDGTGKAPELAKAFIGKSPFLLTYGDILVKPETYAQMLKRYHA